MRLALAVLPLLLVACASKPPRFPVSDVEAGLTPQAALHAEEAQGRRVLWGGVIVNTSNLADSTQIEVLAYPLDKNQRPDVDKTPSGRFLAVQEGYLETADYSVGRQLTVQGRLLEPARGKVGEADYTYPVVRIEDVQLWRLEPRASYDNRPRVNFGFGVMIGR